RTEQEGNRPERTVYQITDKGRTEMISLRDAILRDARLKPDPIDLAIQFLRDELTVEEATMDLAIRKHALQDQLASWKVAQVDAAPHINDMERMVFVHAIRRLELELAWHEELLERLPELIASIPADDF
ncbi:MAG TPA: hypothetical protein VFQ54_05905, partial [Thermomicrobiales bacterium]|nr:hypothetical protein [Thermomicrobiales bacterium]